MKTHVSSTQLRMALALGSAVLFFAFSVAQIRAQNPSFALAMSNASAAPDGLVFLHLRYKPDGTLELLDTQTRPGKLKAGSADAHGHTLNCQVTARSTGETLWLNEIEDPSIRHVEWEDPAQPGHLLSKTVERPGAEFMVRVPLYQKTQHIEFRRKPAARTTETTASTAATESTRNAGQLLGSFDLTLP